MSSSSTPAVSAATSTSASSTSATASTSTSSSSSASASSASALANAEALRLALSHLSGALTYTESTNVETNKKLWDNYAKNYNEKRVSSAAAAGDENMKSAAGATATAAADWVRDMASHVNRSANQIQFLGDEWSDDHSLEQSLNEFLFPVIGVNRLDEKVWREATAAASMQSVSYLPPPAYATPVVPSTELTVAEIGVGGGRIASRVYPHVKQLHCFDISEEMIKQATKSIAVLHAAAATSASSSAASSTPTLPSNISFNLLSNSPQFPSKLHHTCDVVYSFDVLPHVDLHTIYGYFLSIRTLLKPNPVAGDTSRPHPRVFLHTASLCSPLGFDRFSKQSRYTAGGFAFISPDMIRTLARQTGYRIVQESRCVDTPTFRVEDARTLPNEEEFKVEQERRKKNLYYQRDFMFVMEPLDK